MNNHNSLVKVFFYPPFLLMWIAMLLSTIGSFMLLLTLSANILLHTNSTLFSGSIFASQFIAPLFLAPIIAFLCHHFIPKKLLFFNEIITAIVSIAIGFISFNENHYLFLLFVLLVIRGFLDATMKSARIVALKYYIPPDKLEYAASIFNTSYYLGTGFGGLISAFFIEKTDFKEISLLSGFMFLIASVLYSLVNGEEKEQISRTSSSTQIWRKGLQILYGKPILIRSFLYCMLTVGIQQGFHTLARTVIPIKHLGLGAIGVTYYQIISCIATVLGAVFVSLFLIKKEKFSIPLITLFLLGSISMGLPVFVQDPLISSIFYFIFIFFFEVSYTKFSNNLILYCPKSEIGSFFAFSDCIFTACMLLTIFFSGKAIDTFGLYIFTGTLVIFSCILGFLIELKLLKKPVKG